MTRSYTIRSSDRRFKLTDSARANLKADWDAGDQAYGAISRLAEAYGISRQRAHQIIHGRPRRTAQAAAGRDA